MKQIGKNTMMKMKTNIENKKVRFEYTILETYQCGIVLTGNEVKAITNGKFNMTDTYCYFKGSELYVKNISLSISNGDPNRERKLLLKKNELKKLKNSLINGLTIVPLRVYTNERNLIKVDVVLAKGKKLHDKRNTIKERDIQRDIQRNN
jgi:SsrA-binding protein